MNEPEPSELPVSPHPPDPPAAPAEPTTRPAPDKLLEECAFCHGKIVWVTLSNGRRRTFEPREYLTSTVDPRVIEQSGFGLRSGRAVPLDCVQRLPRWMLVIHVCSAYLQARDEQRLGMSRLFDGVELPERSTDGRGRVS